MVYIGYFKNLPTIYTDPMYRLELHEGGGWDVYLDPPADPIGLPLVEAIDDELAN